MFHLDTAHARLRARAPTATSRAEAPHEALALRPGECVRVRSEEEILATLDDRGTLDALPFMPEMRSYCGGRYRVKARADRTFAERAGLRWMQNAVHLDGGRCDGSAHDGCGRGCLMFWKEAWLERSAAPGEEAIDHRPRADHPPSLRLPNQAGGPLLLPGDGARARDAAHSHLRPPPVLRPPLRRRRERHRRA